MAEVDCLEMKNMDCYIAVRGSDNIAELSDVPAEKMSMYERLYQTPVHHGIRVPTQNGWFSVIQTTLWHSFQI